MCMYKSRATRTMHAPLQLVLLRRGARADGLKGTCCLRVLDLCVRSPTPSLIPVLTAITDANVDTAVTAWIADPTTAATTYGNIGGWNTAAVTSMSGLFQGQPTFNDDIGKWNTASVTTMFDMFYKATRFNQDISSWNILSVGDMMSMFSGASVFNGPIGNWNTGALRTLYATFAHAAAFNQNIGGWNTASVSTMSFVMLLANHG
jgi:surface protein